MAKNTSLSLTEHNNSTTHDIYDNINERRNFCLELGYPKIESYNEFLNILISLGMSVYYNKKTKT